MQEIIYRPMQEGEEQLVKDLILSLYQDDPEGEHMTKKKVSLTFQTLRQHPDYGTVLVFQQHSQIIGYAILINFWSNEYGGIVLTIDELLITPALRGQGIGTAFIRYLIDTRYHNFVALKLEVLPYNTRALKLYESLGFRQADRYHLMYSDTSH
jgi:GNAT superfamily N-acetyltransferase